MAYDKADPDYVDEFFARARANKFGGIEVSIGIGPKGIAWLRDHADANGKVNIVLRPKKNPGTTTHYAVLDTYKPKQRDNFDGRALSGSSAAVDDSDIPF